VTTAFQQRYDAVGRLMDKRGCLETAYREAQRLVTDFPEVAAGYYLLNLIVCIGNFGGGARYGSPQIIRRAHEKATDFSDVVRGDMLRDRAIGLIRFHLTSAELDMAQQAIDTARKLHKGHPNRLYCLTGIEGRRAEARGLHKLANQFHETADDGFQSLGAEKDAGMAYLNLIQWLRAVVADEGRNSPFAQELNARIRNECPPQLRSRTPEAFILRLPLVGGRVFRYLETHRK